MLICKSANHTVVENSYLGIDMAYVIRRELCDKLFNPNINLSENSGETRQANQMKRRVYFPQHSFKSATLPFKPFKTTVCTTGF